MRSSELELDQDPDSSDLECEPSFEWEPCVLRERERVPERWLPVFRLFLSFLVFLALLPLLPSSPPELPLLVV